MNAVESYNRMPKFVKTAVADALGRYHSNEISMPEAMGLIQDAYEGQEPTE